MTFGSSLGLPSFPKRKVTPRCTHSRLQVPRQNKEIIGGKQKNRESSGMGHSMGRVHIQKQDLNTMNLMKFKVSPPFPRFSAAVFLFAFPVLLRCLAPSFLFTSQVKCT
jgi:hypothetical protein